MLGVDFLGASHCPGSLQSLLSLAYEVLFSTLHALFLVGRIDLSICCLDGFGIELLNTALGRLAGGVDVIIVLGSGIKIEDCLARLGVTSRRGR